MLYIHHTSCISPQLTYGADFSFNNQSRDGKLLAVEPDYSGIPPGILRRMGKAVRMGVGAALPLLQLQGLPEAVVLGTAIGGMEDCIKFLNQIIQYEEGMLTPGNFVQSTPNAVASQIGLMTKNTGYNITHVHRGLAFEMALMDVMMMSAEKPDAIWLTGAVDEISNYNYNIENLGGWYKSENISSADLFKNKTAGSLAGEGAAMFLVSGKKDGAVAVVLGLETIHSDDPANIAERWGEFLKSNTDSAEIDLIISGENGDIRLDSFYEAVENKTRAGTDIIRFKQLCGEFPTASGFALWLASRMAHLPEIPASWYKNPPRNQTPELIGIYNNYKGKQHSFMLIRSWKSIASSLP